jgi:hypothetical protein
MRSSIMACLQARRFAVTICDRKAQGAKGGKTFRAVGFRPPLNLPNPLKRRESVERVEGIEPSSQAWEARILPLNHTRFDS